MIRHKLVLEGDLIYQDRETIDALSVQDLLFENWEDINRVESFYVVALNSALKPMGLFRVSSGTATFCIADLKQLMQYAILSCASAIIVAHNHPCGMLTESEADQKMLKHLKKACEIFGIQLTDCLILSPDKRTHSMIYR